MKKIKLSEGQFRKLMNENIPYVNDGSIKPYMGSEVSVGCNISDEDGEPKFPNPNDNTADRFQDMQSVQNWWRGHANGSYHG